MMHARRLTFSAFAILLVASSFARAEDTVLLAPDSATPFDPVFAPAVGPNETNLAISLKQHINPDYIRATKRLEFAQSQQTEPQMAVVVEPPPAPASQEQVVAPAPTTSARSPSETSILDSLLNLFGLANEQNDPVGGLVEEQTTNTPQLAALQPQTLEKPETVTAGEPAALIPNETVAADPPAIASEPSVETSVEANRAPEPEETTAQHIPEETAALIPNETVAADPPAIASESSVETSVEANRAPEPEETTAQHIPEETAALIPNETVAADPPAIASEPSVETSVEANRAPEPEETTAQHIPEETAALIPNETVAADPPAIEPNPFVETPVEANPAPEPSEDSNFFQELFGLLDSDDTESVNTETITTRHDRESGTIYSRDDRGVQSVTVRLPEPEEMLTSELAPEPAPELEKVTEPEQEIIIEPEPDPSLPVISRAGPEPTFVDAVAAFFQGSTDGVHQRQATSEGGDTVEDSDTGPAAQTTTHRGKNGDGLQISRQIVPQATQLASVTGGSVETPLVDAAIEQGQGQSIDPDDPGFIVNVPVPSSDEVILTEEKLTLGAEGKLGRTLPFSDDPGKHCVRRLSGRTWVCLESLGWPAVIADAFMARGVPEGRTPAIIRYDNGSATQYRVSFPAQSYDRIMFHFMYLLGEPTERRTVMVPIFANPKQPSRVIRWVAELVPGMPPAVLELREIEDVRWMETPDTTNGVVRLYRQGMKPVFSIVMSGDLRLIEMRRMGSDEPEFSTAPE